MTDRRSRPCRLESLLTRLAIFLLGLAALCSAAHALDRVTIGANWLAEAEHGGFYQAVADGTYARYGLDVTMFPAARRRTTDCCSPRARSTSTWATI